MGNPRADSMTNQIRALAAGESYSKSYRLDLEEAAQDMTPVEALLKIRNMLNQSVGRLRKEDPGSNFRVESGVALNDSKNALLATVVVTRFADGDEGDADDI